MFTWICPQCGREVLPSQSECPACAEKAEAAKQPVAAPPPQPQQAPRYAPAPAQPQYASPPQQQYAPPPQQYAPQPIQYGPPPSKGLPSWVVTLLVAGGLLGAGALAYRFLPSNKTASDDSETVAEKPASKKGASGKDHKYAKHLEIAGVRLSEDPRQRLIVKLTVINHLAADMSGLKLTVMLKIKGKSEKILAEVPVSVPNLGPLESKDVTVTVPTKLRAYELPDWQFLETSFDITAP